MTGLKRRIAALEGAEPAKMDLAVRCWLGMGLTAVEQADLDARPPVPPMTAEDRAALDKAWYS